MIGPPGAASRMAQRRGVDALRRLMDAGAKPAQAAAVVAELTDGTANALYRACTVEPKLSVTGRSRFATGPRQAPQDRNKAAQARPPPTVVAMRSSRDYLPRCTAHPARPCPPAAAAGSGRWG